MSKLREVSLDLGTEFGLTKKIIVNSILIEVGKYEDQKGQEIAQLNKDNQQIRVDYQILWLKEDGTIFKSETKKYSQKDEATLTAWDLSTTDKELGEAFEERILWYLNNKIVPTLG
jgi:hypothetical protein